MMKISIITVSYNSAKTIEETILSVIKQKTKEIEYLIIDGGSSDGTLSIIEKYKDSIDVVISEPDKGISDAFNKGIRKATGEVIGIINSDDFLAENALQTLGLTMQDFPNGDVYFGKTVMFSDIDNVNYIYTPKQDIKGIDLYMCISHPGTFVRKEAYKKYGLFDTELKCAMDFDLVSRMYIGGAKFVYVNSILTWFRQEGISNNQSDITRKESVKIAVRNGVSKRIAQNYYNHIFLKEFMIRFCRKIGIESLLRKLVKGQTKSVEGRYWFDKTDNT